MDFCDLVFHNPLRPSDAYMCVINHNWLIWWLVAWPALSHYLNQSLNIVNQTHLRGNFNDILIEILAFSFKKMHLEMPSGKGRPYCLSLNVLIKTCITSGIKSALVQFVTVRNTRITVLLVIGCNLKDYPNPLYMILRYSQTFYDDLSN